MQDLGYELPRIPIPRTRVNRGERRKVRRSEEQPGAKREPGERGALRDSEPKGPSLLRRAADVGRSRYLGCQEGSTSFALVLKVTWVRVPPVAGILKISWSFPL